MNIAVAFGEFDSLHIGHRAVIERLKNYTYPVVVIHNDNTEPFVYCENERRYLLNQMGIKAIYSIDSDVYKNNSLEDYVSSVLIKKTGATVIVTGKNFDKLEQLREICRKLDISLDVVDTVFYEGAEVTDRLVKKALAECSFEETVDLLGEKYLLMGTVVNGKGVGNKHGMPTANLKLDLNKMFPKYGVYATDVEIDGELFKGITNIGLRPTDDNIPIPTCETLILDFNRIIYGKEVVLKAYKYVRPVKKFADLDELKKQIETDIRNIY